MSGVKWSDIHHEGQIYDMTHLHEKKLRVRLDGGEITLSVRFGFHVFTDEKGDGKMIRFQGEYRHFSVARYKDSFNVLDRIKGLVNGGYVKSFVAGKRGRRYYHLSNMDEFLLLEIRSPKGEVNHLNVNVVTSYPLDDWGDKSNLPRGKSLLFRYVLERRVVGEHV